MKTRRRRSNKNNKTKKNNKKHKMSKPKRVNGEIFFKDHPEFRPNLSPKQIFKLGSFGGTYWRPIKSKFFKETLKNKHKKYPKSWWKNIPEDHLTRPFNKYDTKINKYGKKVGTTLQFWQDKGWIDKQDPYGWVQWYCEFYLGRRTNDDERQISRFNKLAGSNGRFRKWLVTQILKKGTKKDWNNHTISPAIRQTLQHWGYKLKKKDFDKEVKNRK
tara:strand:- start:1141 stop:1788 length:648 start_codon:yes stop_codon:yes gene_type:complete